MDSIGNIRISLLALLLVLLSCHTYVALVGWFESPIGTKDALLYEQVNFFPAITICPYADPEFEVVISFKQSSTFKEAAEMAIKPVVYEKFYKLFKESNDSEASIADTNVFSKYMSLSSMNGYGSFFQECQTFTYPANGSEWIPWALSLTMDVKNVSQYTIFVHQHNKIYPECAEPYGLHSIKVVPHREPGIMETRGFLIKDTLMKGLPHDGLPCHINKEDEVLGYDGGIGECIDNAVEDDIGCKLPWTTRGNNLDECNTTQHLIEYTQTLQRLMYFGEARYYKITGCKAQCNHYYYSTKQNFFQQKKVAEYGNDTSTLRIILFHPSSKITVREEFYVNNINSLFGNIGGMVGALIGASILSLADYILAFTQKGAKKAKGVARG